MIDYLLENFAIILRIIIFKFIEIKIFFEMKKLLVFFLI